MLEVLEARPSDAKTCARASSPACVQRLHPDVPVQRHRQKDEREEEGGKKELSPAVDVSWNALQHRQEDASEDPTSLDY